MIDWVEYAIARHCAQLRSLSAERTLTDRERVTLEVCESVTERLESHGSRLAKPGKRLTAPLVKSAYRG